MTKKQRKKRVSWNEEEVKWVASSAAGFVRQHPEIGLLCCINLAQEHVLTEDRRRTIVSLNNLPPNMVEMVKGFLSTGGEVKEKVVEKVEIKEVFVKQKLSDVDFNDLIGEMFRRFASQTESINNLSERLKSVESRSFHGSIVVENKPKDSEDISLVVRKPVIGILGCLPDQYKNIVKTFNDRNGNIVDFVRYDSSVSPSDMNCDRCVVMKFTSHSWNDKAKKINGRSVPIVNGITKAVEMAEEFYMEVNVK